MKVIANDGEFQISINDKIIALPAYIREGMIVDDIFVVVLDTEYSMRNVFAFDSNGNQVWQIEDPGVETRDSGYALVSNCEGELLALFRGAQYSIDPKTGKIIDITFDK